MHSARWYQTEAVDGLYKWFEEKDGNPLLVMPTGTGKSFVQSLFIQRAVDGWADTRILCLTHVAELISQNFAALIRLWPEAPAGIYSAILNKRDARAQILFAGIQSVHRKAYELQWVDLIMIDEAHLLSRKDSGMYQRLIKDLKSVNPALKIIGLTATPYRMDSGLLYEGEGALFHGIAYEVHLLEMVKQGYLCPVVPKQTDTQFDVSQVGTRGGEFIAGQLETAVDTTITTAAVVDEIVKCGEDRGSWLIFCSGVGHAEHVAEEIGKWGIHCAVVTGDTPQAERNRILTEFKAGRLRAIANVGVLTTGFDAPGVDLIAMLRPTKSVSLYIQMCGRGTRLAEGKEDCLILDFAGNTLRHGPLDLIDGKGRTKKTGDEPGDAPAKACPQCKTIVPASTRICGCGHEFPPPKPQIARFAASAPLLSTQIRPQWVDVQKVSYGLHDKTGKPRSMVVTYHCGLNQHREWVCFEHTDFPRQKACQWWAKRMPGKPIPATVADALAEADGLPSPVAISVQPEGKFTRINSVRFG